MVTLFEVFLVEHVAPGLEGGDLLEGVAIHIQILVEHDETAFDLGVDLRTGKDIVDVFLGEVNFA